MKTLYSFGIPIWCHPHGAKMMLTEFNKQKRILVISGSAAKVVIRESSSVIPNLNKLGWFVDWEVIQYKPREEKTNGRVWFSTKDLESAFGLSEESGNFGQWLIERYRADVAEQGKYIRYKTFLNIPCPGTGNDGDPNVSIHLDRAIKKSIKELITV